MASQDRDRAVALSLQLAQAHQELRRQLGEVRSTLHKPRPGGGTLITHCLGFCAALTAHHHGEDAGMFADLLEQRPDLADTVKYLVQDHDIIASILTRLAELAYQAAATQPTDRDSMTLEFNGLAAIMESHFRYEERAIGNALDGQPADAEWADQVLRFRPEPP